MAEEPCGYILNYQIVPSKNINLWSTNYISKAQKWNANGWIMLSVHYSVFSIITFTNTYWWPNTSYPIGQPGQWRRQIWSEMTHCREMVKGLVQWDEVRWRAGYSPCQALPLSHLIIITTLRHMTLLPPPSSDTWYICGRHKMSNLSTQGVSSTHDRNRSSKVRRPETHKMWRLFFKKITQIMNTNLLWLLLHPWKGSIKMRDPQNPPSCAFW